MKYILGINAFHADSSACLLVNGEVVAAAEEERFRRIKHWAGFPSRSIAWCLDSAGIRLDQVSHVAINQDSGANLDKKLGFVFQRRPELGLILDRLKNRRKREGIPELLQAAFPGQRLNATVHAVEHHVAHLASAHFASPFEESVAVSVDGFGDFASAAWGVGRGTRLDVEARVYFPHSLGIFYQALTQYLGFPNYGDEYKVMGLAPYGKPAYVEPLRRLVRLNDDGGFSLDLDYFVHHRSKIAMDWDDGIPSFSTLHSDRLVELLGPARMHGEPLEQRHRDIAHSVQAVYEEAFFHLLERLHARHRLPAVSIAGGCGMNSVANGKVTLRTPFERVYVQAAAGDAGGAVGAALSVWHGQGGARAPAMMHAYLGPEATGRTIEALLAERGDAIAAAGCSVQKVDDEGILCRDTAQAIADGHVVGWFQGAMEWGPRALGNRSILGDPRRADMKDILNLKIKRRESFRPFAPSVLREATAEWFEIDADVPFMGQVFQIRNELRNRIPAVTHVDGSGRLQTVTESSNPRYYFLIKSFKDLTGVPMLLNTSFNENEPVVCTPAEALDCFLRTNMDRLVLGDHVLRRIGGVLEHGAQAPR